MAETITLHLPTHGDFECATFNFNLFYSKSRSVLIADVLDATQWGVTDVTRLLQVELAIVAASLTSLTV